MVQDRSLNLLTSSPGRYHCATDAPLIKKKVVVASIKSATQQEPVYSYGQLRMTGDMFIIRIHTWHNPYMYDRDQTYTDSQGSGWGNPCRAVQEVQVGREVQRRHAANINISLAYH